MGNFKRTAELASTVGTQELIWNKTGAYTYATANERLEISSSDAKDVISGVGARTVKINGLTSNFEERNEIVRLGDYATNLITNGNMTAAVAGTDFENFGKHSSLAIAAGVATFTPLAVGDGIIQDSTGGTIPITNGKKYLVRAKATTPVGKTKQLSACLYGLVGGYQQETATLTGTITLAGTVKVTVKGNNIIGTNGLYGTDYIKYVSVALNDNASQIAAKIVTALDADTRINGVYKVTNSTDTVIFTALTKRANDTTLNIKTENGTCTGVTTAATSANTTAGLADASISEVTPFDLVATEDGVELACIITAIGTASSATFGIIDVSGTELVEITLDNIMLINLTSLDYQNQPLHLLKALYTTYFAGAETTKRTLYADYFRINGFSVLSAGTELDNAGNISLKQVTGVGTNVYAYIEASKMASQQLLFTVPKNKTLSLHKILATSVVAGQPSKISLQTNYNRQGEKILSPGVWIDDITFAINDKSIDWAVYQTFPEKSEIRVVTSGSSLAGVTCTLIGDLA